MVKYLVFAAIIMCLPWATQASDDDRKNGDSDDRESSYDETRYDSDDDKDSDKNYKKGKKKKEKHKRLRPPRERTRVLWGDTHVHTSYSFDAWLTMVQSIPEADETYGEIIYDRDVREACDYAHYCSRLDFMVSTEHAENVTVPLWSQIKTELRDCDADLGDDTKYGLKPLHVFAGFEWTQGNPVRDAETSSSTQYGHKNVIYPDLEEEKLPPNVIGAGGGELAVSQIVDVVRACPLVLPPENCGVVPDGQDGLDYSTPGTPCYATCDFFTQCDAACAPGGAHYPQCLSQPENADCPLFAYTAEDLFNTVRGFSKNTKVPLPVIGAHGTSWATGGSTDWGVNYPEDDPAMDRGNFAQHDPELQKFFEVHSKHGSSEEFGPEGAGDPLVCNDCFKPGSSGFPDDNVYYAKNGSYQYMLSQEDRRAKGGTFALDLGAVGSADTHHARPGSVMPALEFAEVESAEVFCELNGLDAADCPLEFTYTGGLAAVHTKSHDSERDDIFDGLRDRLFYGTSGPRIDLWFFLTNPRKGECDRGECPMGSVVERFKKAPEFRVHARGALPYTTDCDARAIPAGYEAQVDGGSFQDEVCMDRCYTPTSDKERDRLRISHFEVVRVLRGDSAPTVEPLDEQADWGWNEYPYGIEVFKLACEGDESGRGRKDCWANFSDPDFRDNGENAVYYVRAIQEPTQTINGLAGTSTVCEASEFQESVEDCYQTVSERAWSSPIFVYRDRVAETL